MSWRRKILQAFCGGSLAALERIEHPFPPFTIRAYSHLDLERCSEIYLLNEPGRFPEGLLKNYQKSLNGQESLYFVAEVGGRIIGTGGIAVGEYTDNLRIILLSYGLVDPAYHGRGYSTALLVFRLSLLCLSRWHWVASMTSAGSSTFSVDRNVAERLH